MGTHDDPRLKGSERTVDVVNYGSALLPGTNTRRTVPAPWVDCEHCSWRHYPNVRLGRWHIATACASCGEQLPGS